MSENHTALLVAEVEAFLRLTNDNSDAAAVYLAPAWVKVRDSPRYGNRKPLAAIHGAPIHGLSTPHGAMPLSVS